MQEGPVHISKNQEHLKEGVEPIVACMWSTHILKNEARKEYDLMLQDFNIEENPNADYVDYCASVEDLESHNFLHGEHRGSYVISTINDHRKFSTHFFRCTGLVVAGRDKNTHKNISFLTHQDPNFILISEKDRFTEDLKKRLIELEGMCEVGTIDAVIVGGTSSDEIRFEQDSHDKMRYLNSIDLLSAEVRKVFNFEPIIINGPKFSPSTNNPDSVYYDNEKRRLYFVRKYVNSHINSFTNSEVDKGRNPDE